MTSPTSRSQAASRTTSQSPAAEAVLLTVALAFVAASIHAVASIGHFGELWLFGVFFAALAIAQFGWGAWLFGDCSTTSLSVGLALNAPVVAIWLISRTVGLPVGPDAWRPESIGALDVAATVDECQILFLVYLLMGGGSRLGVFQTVVRPVVYVVLIVSGVVLLMGGHHAS